MSNEINNLLKKMDDRLERQDNMLQQLIQMIAKNNERFDKMDQSLERIEQSVNRIELNEPTDIMAMLKQINGKLDNRDNEIQALNKRLFKTETDIERLTRQ